MQKKSSRYINLIVILAILVIFTFRENTITANTFNATNNYFLVTFPDETVHSVKYTEVTSLELLKDVDYGSCVSGEDSGSWYYGTWENDVWGSYELSVSTSLSCCIVLKTEEETLVINNESDAVTEALYEALQEYCEAV